MAALRSSCRLAVLVLAACLLLLSGGCNAARRLRQETAPTPWEYISTTPGLEILARLLMAANLTSALNQHNLAYTLFLPNNASFAALEADQGLSVDMLLNNSALQSVLLYHVYTGGAIANLTVNSTLTMANGAPLMIVNDTNIGIPLALRDEMGRVSWPIPSGVNISSTVGMSQVYIISRVLLPIKPKTIEEAMSYETSMSTILAALNYAASLETDLPADQRVITNLLLSNTTNVTFLVPTNDAFSSLCVNVTELLANPDYLLKTLLSHVLPVAMDLHTLSTLNGTTIPTLYQNASFTVDVMYGTILLYGNGQVPSTLIVSPDLVAGNSYLQVINTVLFPETPDKPQFVCPTPIGGDYGTTPSDYSSSDGSRDGSSN